MILSPTSITHHQACIRRELLERQWKPTRERPHNLFDHCLRQAILRLSAGIPVARVRAEAIQRFLAQATNPGLDYPIGSDSYLMSMDWVGMLSVSLTAISRRPLDLVKLPSLERLGDFVWQASSLIGRTLHRWITVDRWDAPEISRQLHSWYTVGDMAVFDMPLELHVIEIGQVQRGRRQSAWARAYKDPLIAGRFRFQRKDGFGGHRALKGNWQPLWYADQPKPDPEMWVDLMDKDGVTDQLIHHSLVSHLPAAIRGDTLKQLETIGKRISAEMREPMDAPMSRGACDQLSPCPFQGACFRAEPWAPVEEAGLYSLLPNPRPPSESKTPRDIFCASPQGR
jgi:hypothetical protein